MSPLCLVLFAAVATAVAAPQKYTTKYDNINLDQVLRNDRLLNNYFRCLMDQGSCTPDGDELKSHIRDALETACSKCSEKQRAGTEKVVRFLIKNKPTEFADLEKKYDPRGVYRAKYQAEAKKKGITV
ncbi:ejaculatory bulb-specific protein 3-like [Homalodisca vitripennis]|uniref:ejaculatory bulb-specific protein 3-like n=1 Tax=Homalodisca vitripennis TaxID=197043 RepID=UPI001EEA9F6F|nr:ejaculatory bulb-specific protein 3-like [Homalodisca vitripennis]KAG8330685.1 hypothetical protein J6590_057259 [Homalodisca vitripennis]